MMMGSLSSNSDDGGLQIRAIEFYSSTTASASHALTIPDHDDDDLLVCCAGVDDGYTLTPSAGWTYLNGSCSFQSCQRVYYKVADGSDALTISVSGARQLSAVVFAIRNADTVSASFFTSSGSADVVSPPSHTATPGAAKYLWIATYTGEAGSATNTGTPSANLSQYSDWETINTSIAFGFFAAECHRITTSNTEDPNGSTSITVGGYPLYPVSATLAVFKAP